MNRGLKRTRSRLPICAFGDFVKIYYLICYFLCRRHLILSCQGNLAIFPFDDPVCTFAVESSKFCLAKQKVPVDNKC